MSEPCVCGGSIASADDVPLHNLSLLHQIWRQANGIATSLGVYWGPRRWWPTVGYAGCDMSDPLSGASASDVEGPIQ